MAAARHGLGNRALERLSRWRAELRDHGLRTAILLRLREQAGTAELARSLRVYFDANNSRVERLERLASIPQASAWIEQATLATSPLVSVILPTRNRASLLPAAIASVSAQTYSGWELVIVDDGSDDETAELLAALEDPRIRTLRIEPSGVGAARNAALSEARGELIAYLDDDNTMHRGWLKAVVWAFEQRPEVEFLYGAIVIDDVARGDDRRPAELPLAFLNGFDRRLLTDENLADVGAIAHRAGLEGARFDEQLVTMGDWDLLARVCAEREPLVLPVIASFYSTAAPDRLTGGPTEAHDAERVRERARAAQGER